MKRQRPSSSSPLLLLLQNSGFYNTDNTDASLLLSHPSTSTSTTTTSRFFWRLRKFHDILPWMRDFLLLQRRGFWSGLDWGCIIVKAVAPLLLLAFTACKKRLCLSNDGCQLWCHRGYIFTMTLSGFHVTTQESFHYHFRGEWFSDYWRLAAIPIPSASSVMITIKTLLRHGLCCYFQISSRPSFASISKSSFSSCPWIKCQ